MSLFRIPAAVLLRRGTLNRGISTQSLRLVQPATPSTPALDATGKCLANQFIFFKNYRKHYSTEASAATTTSDAAAPQGRLSQNDWREKLAEWKSTNALNETTLMEVLAYCRRAQDFETALQALEMAKETGMELTAEIYSYVVASGLSNIRFVGIRELFGEPLPEMANFQAAKGPGKNYDKVKELLGEMKERHFELPMWFYEQLVSRMTFLGQAGIVVNLVVTLEKRGIVPSISLYNKALHLLPRKGMTDRAESLFNKLVMKGLANYQTYTTWMGSLVLMERYNEVEQVFRSLSKMMTPDIVAYNILINSRLKGDNFTGALDLFDSLRQRQVEGVYPDQYSVSTFLDHMLSTGNVQHSQRLFPYLAEIGFPSTSQNYGLLLRFYARYDEAQFSPMLKQILAEKPELQDIYFYNALLRILTDNQVLADVKKELGVSVSEKLDMSQTSALLDTLANAPLATRAIAFLMERSNIRPDEYTFECFMRQMLNRHEYDSLERIYSYALESNANPSYTLRNMRLTGVLMGKDLGRAEKVLDEMRAQRVPIYPRNLSLCKELGVQIPEGVFSPTGRLVRNEGGRNEGGRSSSAEKMEYI